MKKYIIGALLGTITGSLTTLFLVIRAVLSFESARAFVKDVLFTMTETLLYGKEGRKVYRPGQTFQTTRKSETPNKSA